MNLDALGLTDKMSAPSALVHASWLGAMESRPRDGISPPRNGSLALLLGGEAVVDFLDEDIGWHYLQGF